MGSSGRGIMPEKGPQNSSTSCFPRHPVRNLSSMVNVRTSTPCNLAGCTSSLYRLWVVKLIADRSARDNFESLHSLSKHCQGSHSHRLTAHWVDNEWFRIRCNYNLSIGLGKAQNGPSCGPPGFAASSHTLLSCWLPPGDQTNGRLPRPRAHNL